MGKDNHYEERDAKTEDLEDDDDEEDEEDEENKDNDKENPIGENFDVYHGRRMVQRLQSHWEMYKGTYLMSGFILLNILYLAAALMFLWAGRFPVVKFFIRVHRSYGDFRSGEFSKWSNAFDYIANGEVDLEAFNTTSQNFT